MPWEVILDALVDTLKVTPFLFAVFVLLEFVEHAVSKQKYVRLLSGRLSPLIGAATGVIPMCGFSVMAATLYQNGKITLGALLAIMLASSDEAVVLLITNGRWADFGIMLAIKIAVAVAVGYVANLFVKNKEDGILACDKADGCGCRCEGGKLHRYLLHPLRHALEIAAFVLAVNVCLGLIIYFAGQDGFARFMADTGYYQPFVSALVGLIPNCAGSAAIVAVYVGGNLSFGGLVAGMISSAGVGLAVLLKGKGDLRTSLIVVATLYIAGVVAGEIVNLIASFI